VTNVLYVTVDSIRADHTGHLGYDRPTTPTIDRLAERGTACPRAVAAGIPTFYSFKSLLGGLPALGHSRAVGMPGTATTLAEAFCDRGYDTAGFNAGNPWLTREYGYDRGFETFRDFLTDGDGGGAALTRLTRRVQPYVEASDLLTETLGLAARVGFALVDHTPIEPAETVTDAAVEWLRGRDGDRPFFLWVHYMDPHYPWVPRDVDVDRFCDGSVTSVDVGRLWHAVSAHESDDENTSGDRGEDGNGDGGGSEGEGGNGSPVGAGGDADGPAAARLDRIVDLYDAEIRRTDDAIDRLLDALADAGQRDDTVVAVAGDHGTELLDHGGFSHGPRTLYEEVVRVPLVFAGPGVPRARTAGVTSLQDVPVSLLDAVGIEPPESFGGVPAFADEREAAVAEVVYDYEPRSGANADNGLLRACVDPPWKLIRNEELGTRELYRLDRDPGERRDVAAANPGIVDRLTARLDDARGRIERRNDTVRERAHARSVIADLKGRGRI